MKLALKLPSLSTTAGKVPAGPGRMRAMLRRARGLAGWIALSIVFFVLFAWLSLPTRAIAWRIGHEAKKAGYIVDVEDVSVSLLGNVTLHNVTWTFAPSRPDQIPGKFLIEEVEVSISFLSLLVGNIDVEVEGRREEGRLFASYERDSSESEIHVAIEDLPLYDVPKARQALNAPLMGLFAFKLDLVLPGNKFAKSTGAIEITCAACRIGDGETKLYIPGSKGLKDGVTIPEIDLGTFVGKMVVDKGVATTEGAMETNSDDIEVSVVGEINLKDPFPKSRMDMTVKVNLTDSLQARSEKLRLVFQGADAKSRLDPPEKGLGYVLSGFVTNPKFKGIKSKSARDSRADRRAKQRAKDEKKRASTAAKEDKADEDKVEKPDGEDKLDPRPALPGIEPPPVPPSAPAGADPSAGVVPTLPAQPMPTAPDPNAPDPNAPDPNAAPVEPPAEPPAEPQAEPVPAPEPIGEGGEALPPDGNFGGTGPIGEPVP